MTRPHALLLVLLAVIMGGCGMEQRHVGLAA